jgi:hypothetical protein
MDGGREREREEGRERWREGGREGGGPAILFTDCGTRESERGKAEGVKKEK